MRRAPIPEPRAVDAAYLAEGTPGARLAALESRPSGLTAAEASQRAARYGLNEPVRPGAVHPLRSFAAQFTHTLALLLWFAAGLAFAAGIPELGAAVVAVVVLNGTFAFFQEYRAEQVVGSLTRRVATTALVVRESSLQPLPATDIVMGDVVHLSAGDIVPADCVVLEADGLSLDLSMLTGESEPVARSAEPVQMAARAGHIAEVPCFLPGGSAVVEGTASAVAWRTGPASTIGEIAGLVAGVRKESSALERQVGALSRATAVIAVFAGATTLMLAAAFAGTDFLVALTFATGVLVALVPEGLLPTLSVSLALGARRMADRGAAARRLSAVEIVGSVTVICTDKTGTLTQNALSVAKAIAADGSDRTREDLLRAVALCNDAEATADGGVAGDAVDSALWRWAVRQGLNPALERERSPRTADVPFHAQRRYKSVTCTVDGHAREFVKGAPEAVLDLCGGAGAGDAVTRAMKEAMSTGQRVLLAAAGPAGGPLAPVGLISLEDPPRAGVADAIRACRAAGIRVIMLTGDHPDTARAVGDAVALTEGPFVTLDGTQVDAMPDRELRVALAANAVIARVDPAQKLRIVKVLRSGGEIVVVTGDGVNDAPALRAADVGVAMGLRGTEVAKQAADIVLADDNFVTIVAAIDEGRAMRANIRRFVSYVFTSNVAEMVPFLVYIFLPVPLPLAVIQALAIDIGTDLLPALALGAEPPSKGTMDSPPEPPSHPLLTRALGLRTFLFFGVIEAALGLGGFMAFYLDAGWRPGDSFDPFESIAHEATTITFLAIVGGQVGCLFAQRDGPLRARLSLSRNRWIAGGLAFELTVALILVYTPGLNRVFSMAAVDPWWLAVVPLSAVVFLASDQCRRALRRHRVNRQP